MPAAAAPTTRHPPSVRNKGAGGHLLNLSSSIMTARGPFHALRRRFRVPRAGALRKNEDGRRSGSVRVRLRPLRRGDVEAASDDALNEKTAKETNGQGTPVRK